MELGGSYLIDKKGRVVLRERTQEQKNEFIEKADATAYNEQNILETEGETNA